jgi:hypothetical protein
VLAVSVPSRLVPVVAALTAAIAFATPAQARPGWTPAAPLDQAIDGPAATRLPDGRVLLAGGRVAGAFFDGAEIYDPRADAWSPAGQLTFERDGGQLTVLADGRVILTGGDEGVFIPRLQVYDPETNSWSASSDAPGAVVLDQAVPLIDGTVLVTGRAFGGGRPALRWHPDTDTWTPAADLPAELTGASLVRLPDGRVLAAGSGEPSSRDPTVTAAAAIYDPITDRWSRTAPMAHPRGPARLVLLRSGEVLAVGGYADAMFTPVLEAERFDPVAERWSDAGTLPYPLFSGAVTRMEDGSVLAPTYPDLASYDPATNRWAAGGLHPPRAAYAVVGLRDGRALVAGGAADTELRDPYTTLAVAPLQFGGHPVGSAPAVGYVPVRNTGDSDLELDPPAISGAEAGDFRVVSNSCMTAVAPRGGCLIGVAFTPGATGERRAVLSFADSTPSQLHAAALLGTGIAPVHGPQGPPGPRGSTGPRGPRGRDARVTCRVRRVDGKRRMRCTVRYGTGRATARLRLARGRTTVGRSRATLHHGRARMTLRPRHRLRHGRYRISVTVSTRKRNVVAETTVRVR